ncbi:MAG TPA: PQQ-dependent sugar dehydrogenase [Gemmatimonadales bacterium]
MSRHRLSWTPAALALIAPVALLASPSVSFTPPACAPDNGGLTVPKDFCAIVVDDDAGSVRQLVVAPDGALYAAISGHGFGGGVRAYRDRDGDGKPDEQKSFGPRGGNDVAIHDGYLYLALNDRVIRWRLTPGRLEPEGKSETIVEDLPVGGNHQSKSVVVGGGDSMFVSIGSATNSCQRSDRHARSPGIDPCTELDRRAGIWQFSASKAGQTFASGRRYATGMRNPLATTIQPGTGALFAAIHGRDQLGDSWGFSVERNAENPAEELVDVRNGDDFGWPYCYYSVENKAKVLAPEYGGDGKKVGRCAKAKNAAIPFPAHWAPLALAFYSSDRFGEKYKNGLFVAFHGSWNRAPLPQAGYRVVFAPFADGKPTGQYETFATSSSGPTDLRASGVAVASDGGLYISADQNGKIWKVVKK